MQEPEHSGQPLRIAPVGLHPVASLLRIERSRNANAGLAAALDQSVEAVTVWPRLSAERQLAVLDLEHGGQLAFFRGINADDRFAIVPPDLVGRRALIDWWVGHRGRQLRRDERPTNPMI